MKHKSKLIEQKRRTAAFIVTLRNKCKDVPISVFSDIHISQLMGVVDIGENTRKLVLAVNKAVEEYENSQKS